MGLGKGWSAIAPASGAAPSTGEGTVVEPSAGWSPVDFLGRPRPGPGRRVMGFVVGSETLRPGVPPIAPF